MMPISLEWAIRPGPLDAYQTAREELQGSDIRLIIVR
jgi:hypothetical protein